MCRLDEAIHKSVLSFRKRLTACIDKMLSYRRQTALQDALVFAKNRRLELEDNILQKL